LLADVVDGTELDRGAARAALVELVMAGLATNDTLEALHAVLGHEPAMHRPVERSSALEAQLATLLAGRPRRPSRHHMRQARRHAREVSFAAVRRAPASWPGRWSLVHRPSLLGKPAPADELARRRARLLLARWGVVTKASLEREAATFQWEALYPALAQMEMRGEARRGYFVEGLPGIQFAPPDAVERLRMVHGDITRSAAGAAPLAVLAAADPAQIFGGEVPGAGLRFSRTASAAVATAGGVPVAVMTEGAAAVDVIAGHPAAADAIRALAGWWAGRTRARLKVERWNGEPDGPGEGAALLEAAGFVRDFAGHTWPQTASAR
jgi:ATP-dependent Lhr-like helicase